MTTKQEEYELPKYLVWDYDVDAEQMRQYIKDKNCEAHLWAVARVLEKGQQSDINELLTIADVIEDLPKVKIPKVRRFIFKKILQFRLSEINVIHTCEYDDQFSGCLEQDSDVDIDALRHHIHDKNSELRFQAIGQVLDKGTIKDIQELLTVEDINEALPIVTLSDDRRNLFEISLRVWQNTS